jgi:hypothetical protein
MNTNETITLMLMELIAKGMNAKEALMEVCGKETVEKMINDIYEQLKKIDLKD